MKRIIKNPEERRAEIIAAAYQLFMTTEYDKITMQDIIDTLNIAKGTIYHYFPSKQALLQAVIEDIANKTYQHMQQVIENMQGTALDKIKTLVKIGNMSHENQELLDHLHRHHNDILHTRLLMAVLAQQAPLYAQLIQQGCNEGLFTSAYPHEAAEFILYAVQILTDTGLYTWTQQDFKRRAEAFPLLIEQLLQAKQGSFNFLKEQIIQAGKCNCTL